MALIIGVADPAAADVRALLARHLAEARGQGVARAVLGYLLQVAAAGGYLRVSLETGTMDAFAAARAMYQQAGFRPCAPFGPYTVNPHSVCMTLTLRCPDDRASQSRPERGKDPQS